MADNKNLKDDLIRCPWCTADPLYIQYHDIEWGKPVTDDRTLFEYLTLEGAQAGLSWLTILRKRESYREAFYGFDFNRVAEMTCLDEEMLLKNEGIIRNRLKIRAVIKNARLFKKVIEEFGSFYSYVSSFLPDGKRIVNMYKRLDEIPVSSSVSESLSKDLKKRGFKFVGATICYSFLQATGFIDDHLCDCSFKNLL